MALESGDFIGDLSPADPAASDPKSQGDDHLRLIKKVVQQSFAGFDGAVMVLGTEAQGGSANQFDVTIGAPVTYDDPFIVVFQATHTHPGAPTIQVNGLGYKNLQSFDSTNLSGGAIRVGSIVAALWNGTAFRIVSAVEAARRQGETYSNTHNFGSATLIAPTPSANNHATTKQYVDTTIAASASTKVSKAGDTYTGNHDASGATSFTVPDRSLGDNSSNAANTRYVDQTAFSTVLPNQAGHAGETLLTDGTNASWGHDATKANIAGDTYTGAHNFTGATLTVPTAAETTSSGAVASTAFVRTQPNWEVTDITTTTYTLPSNQRGQMYVCGGSTTTVTLPAPTGRYFVRVHNPNPASVTISAGTGRTINGGASIALQPGSSVTITRDGATSNYRAFFFNVGGGGGAGLPYDTYQDFLTSGTFTVQKTGWHRVTIVGAGGSGGSYQTASSGSDQAAVAAGGGAGGIATTELVLTQGTSYTVTIGAGGASVSGTNDGNAGGTTLVVGPGFSMVANGGGGGESAGTSSGDVSAAGGAGGTASVSGGGETYTGGSGGDASTGGSGGQASRAGGGGSPNILALSSPPNGGPAIRNRSGTTPRTGGGASVGGSGGFADGTANSAAGPMLPVPPADARPTSLPLDDWRLGYPVRGNTPVIGDGRGLGSEGTGSITNPTPAQPFGGGGGITANTNMNAPSGGIGAGGGGRAVVAATGGLGRPSGAGGNGLAIFEWIA